VLQSISFEDDELRSYIAAIGSNLFNTELQRTLLQFEEADNFGSLIRPATTNVSDIRRMLNEKNLSGNLTLIAPHKKVRDVLKQADYLSPKYHVVIANPPYMGGKGMNARLRTFLQENYADVKSDLFSAFIERIIGMIQKGGFIGMMTPFNWMFLKSFEKLRDKILGESTLTNLVRPEFHAFFDSAYVSICGFTLYTRPISNFKGSFIDLQKFYGVSLQPAKALEAINNPDCSWFYRTSAADFKKIPGSPIAYWISDKVREIFAVSKQLSDVGAPKQGLATGANEKFLRLWQETSYKKIGLNIYSREEVKGSGKKWFPCNKGGSFRKWYGNNNHIVNWENDGLYLTNFKGSVIRNPNYYFKEGISWSTISSSSASFRLSPVGFIFETKGSVYFLKNSNEFNYLFGYLNCKLVNHFLKAISPTLDYHEGPLGKLPIIPPESEQTKSHIDHLTQQCIDISREEWDSRETSWDFTTNELLRHKTTNSIEDAYNNYCTHWKGQFFKLHSNEEELNRIFIDIYDLADELTSDVPLEDITILKTESEIKDGELVFKKETLVKQLISYAVGCMFGRYSLDKPGLILANQGETINDYLQQVPEPSFMPDDDNIIPILEDEYFTDDIVGRFKEFLKATFGAESLAENLEFIAGALSKSKNGSASSEKVIRDYFLKSFFKDHVKTYKKRPIYWLFTSGKGRGFNALVYMHRYNRETLAKMRTDYLLELEAKLDARIRMLGDESAAEKGRLGKQIEELVAYDGVLHNKSLEYIDIDLDDGVKVNYAKFEGLVGKI
jgi:type II restriction/modification system DNA methylase subunit YeeA